MTYDDASNCDHTLCVNTKKTLFHGMFDKMKTAGTNAPVV